MGTKGNAKTANATTAKPNEAQADAHLTTPTKLTGSEILWATLAGEGVREVFGYPGGAILPAYDALRKFPIKHIPVRHVRRALLVADEDMLDGKLAQRTWRTATRVHRAV